MRHFTRPLETTQEGKRALRADASATATELLRQKTLSEERALEMNRQMKLREARAVDLKRLWEVLS